MRRLPLLAALCLLVPAAASASPALPLDHAGRWITDARGRVVILHGYNMVFKRPPYAPDATGFGEDDAAFLASEGYDTVRLGLIYKAVEPSPGVYDDAYLDRIATTVDTLARHGIVSLLDFHQDLYNERFQGEGWPDWAVLDDGLPAEPKSGFPGNYLLMPALQRAFDNFWADAAGPGGVGIGDRYAAAWRHVARRFATNPAVLGYDLLNEPWPGTAWQECANPAGCPVADARLQAFTERTLHAIREADPGTLVFYEPYVLFNDGARTNLSATGDAHAAMSFHDYCLQAGSTDSNAGCDTADDLVFANADRHAASTGDALLLTEFGATGAHDILTAMVERADRHMVGWQEWHFCGCDDPTTSGPGDRQAIVRDPSKAPAGDNVDASKLDVLTRPFPQAVAGTPASFGYDAEARRFTLEYGTARADGRGTFGPGDATEVVLPARDYPHGYAAHVRGGSILSAPGERVLRVAPCPSATRVSVEVVASGSRSASCAAPAALRPARTLLRLRLRVVPRRVRAGRQVAVRVYVREGTGRGARPVPGATVRLAGRRAVADDRGRVTIRHRFRRRGRARVTATAPRHTRGRAMLLVRRR